jgi:tetratricopeptide (TPR) repeat protein
LAAESQVLATVSAFDEALAMVERLAAAPGASSRMLMMYAGMIRCSRAASRGDVGPFLALAESIPAAANPRLTGYVYSSAAWLAFEAGRYEDAARWSARSLDLAHGSPGPRALARAVHAQLARVAGDFEAAVADASEAVVHAGLAGVFPAAFIYLAHIDALAAAGRVDDSRAALESAVERIHHSARHLGEYREVLFAIPTYAELLRRAG